VETSSPCFRTGNVTRHRFPSEELNSHSDEMVETEGTCNENIENYVPVFYEK
jgi:hypothetical protein